MSNELTYWSLEDGNRRLSVIEEDFRNQLKKYDSLHSHLEDSEKQNKRKIKRLLENLLEVLDAFDRVFKNIEDKDKGKDIDRQAKIWVGNFKAIRRMMEGVLKDTGISLIEAPEGKAIPGWHTIVATKEVEGLSNDTILEEDQKGYLYHEEVLRKSKVVTVKNKEGGG